MRKRLVFVVLAAALWLGLPAVALGASTQVPLNLSAVTNFLMPTANVPTGTVVWSGTTFRLDSLVFHSRDYALAWYPDELNLGVPEEARNATAVQILVNLDGATADADGRKVGEVVLRWGNGSQQTVDLISGVNVRTWLVMDGGAGSSMSAAPLQDAGSDEVNRGVDVYGRTAVIDRLTVLADPSVASSGLSRITVRDTSFETAGSLDPGLVVRAVTVETLDPELGAAQPAFGE
jgi:hypothetical protein